MKNYYAFGVVFCSAVFVASSGFSLTLNQAMVKVVETNPQIQANKQNTRAAQALVRQARGDFLPTVDLNASLGESRNKVGSASSNGSTPRVLGATARQPLFTGGRNIAAYKARQLQFHAAQATEIANTQTVLLALVNAYTAVLRDKEILTLNEGQVALLAEQLKQAQARFEAGEATITDVKQAEARLAEAEAGKTRANGNLSVTWATLQQILGSKPSKVSWPPLPKSLPQNLAEAKQTAQKSHPSILAAQSLWEAAKEGVAVARSTFYPTVAATANVSDTRDGSGGDVESQTLALELNMPLFRGFKTHAEVSEAKSNRTEAQFNLETSQRDVEQNVVTSFMQYLTSQQTEKSFQKSVEANELAAQGVRAEQAEGLRTVLDVLNAEQELLQAQVNLVESRAGTLNAAYALLQAMGKLAHSYKTEK